MLGLLSHTVLAGKTMNCHEVNNMNAGSVGVCEDQTKQQLKEIYLQLLKHHFEKNRFEHIILLAKSQQAWIDIRDAQCEFVGQNTGIQAIAATKVCRVALTQNRVDELNANLISNEEQSIPICPNAKQNVDSLQQCFEQTQKRLESAYRMIEKQNFLDFKLLQESQYAWLEFKVRHCELVGWWEISYESENMLLCSLVMIDKRTRELEKIAKGDFYSF